MRLSKALTVLLGFMLSATLVGCSGKSQTPEGSTPVSLDGEVVPIELPRDSVEVLLDQVAAGDLTLEEGVVENLKLMVGEIEFAELYGEQTLRQESGWGLSLLAQEVLSSSADEELKSEVRRLLNILAPPRESLDLFAGPYTAQRRSSTTLISSSPARNSAQSVLCNSFWSEGFPRTFEDPPICVLYQSFTAGGHEYRVYFPEARRDDPGFMRYVEAAVTGLRESQERLSRYSEVPDINLTFTLLPSPSSPSAWAAATIPGVGREVLDEVACPITVFPSSLEKGLDELKFTVAHEVFHCISMWRKGYTGYETADWYEEGMAEYFADVVYPSMNFEHARIAYFDANTIKSWLMDLSYENVVFFQYLGGRFGPDYLIRLHDALPAWDPASAQANALAGFDDMQSIFHEFARAYFTSTIPDAGGGTLPAEILLAPENNFEMGNGRQLNLSASAFTLARYGLYLQAGTEYEITKETGGDEGRSAWRDAEDVAFTEIPETFRSTCDERPAYLLILTAAPSGASESTETTLDIELKAKEGLKMDCCLVGTWEQPSGEIRANLETILAGSGMRVESVTGRFVLTVTEERTMTFFPENFVVTIVDPDGRLMTGRVVGTNTNLFTIPSEGQIAPSEDNPNFVIILEGEGGGVSYPLGASDLSGGPFSEGDTFSYTCSERTFTASTEGRAPFSSSTFTRLSPVAVTPPAPDEFPPGTGIGPSGLPDIGAGDACMLLTASDFSAEADTIRWTLSNATTEAAEISAISLNWPGENGSLQEISLESTSIWTGSEAGLIARIDAPWDTSAVLPPGADAALDLRFSGSAAASTPYILVVDFTNGCILSDVR
jgi:hypothetical protein